MLEITSPIGPDKPDTCEYVSEPKIRVDAEILPGATPTVRELISDKSFDLSEFNVFKQDDLDVEVGS